MSRESQSNWWRTLPSARLAAIALLVALLIACLASAGCRTRPPAELVPFTDEMRVR
jgi:hypothetical protein